MKKWKAILFDMDGTLFDTEQISRIAWLATMERFHLPKSEQFILDLIGRTYQSAQVVFDAYMPKGWPQEEAYQYHEDYAMEYKKTHGPLPKCNLKQLFTALQEKGYRLALASSARRENVEFNLRHEGIQDVFEEIVVGKMVAHGKPHPDIYLETAKRLGLRKEDCLVIEDSKNGILAAHAAKMDVIMIPDMIAPDDELKAMCYQVMEKLEDILTGL